MKFWIDFRATTGAGALCDVRWDFSLVITPLLAILTLQLAASGNSSMLKEVCSQVPSTCYSVYSMVKLDQRSADVWCSRKHANGGLAKITDDKSDRNIALSLKADGVIQEYWIGAHHLLPDNLTREDRGESSEAHKRKPRELIPDIPLPPSKRCVVLRHVSHTWHWKAAECNDKNRFICEYPDVDECTTLIQPCLVHENCINTPGSFSCTSKTCPRGYELSFTIGECMDVDECTTLAQPCLVHENCINTLGSFSCTSKTCPRGYELSFTSGECTDVDECSVERPRVCRSAGEVCRNIVGSYRCDCRQGYQRDDSDMRRGCVVVDIGAVPDKRTTGGQRTTSTFSSMTTKSPAPYFDGMYLGSAAGFVCLGFVVGLSVCGCCKLRTRRMTTKRPAHREYEHPVRSEESAAAADIFTIGYERIRIHGISGYIEPIEAYSTSGYSRHYQNVN